MTFRVVPAVTAIAVFLALGSLHAAGARRAADVAGKWQFVMQTDGGPREAAAELKIDGEKVSGTWDTTEVQGTYADGKLDLSFPLYSAEGGMTAKLSVKGQFEEEALTGTWTYGQYAGSFKATRRK
jgi:hypothetical protein